MGQRAVGKPRLVTESVFEPKSWLAFNSWTHTQTHTDIHTHTHRGQNMCHALCWKLEKQIDKLSKLPTVIVVERVIQADEEPLSSIHTMKKTMEGIVKQVGRKAGGLDVEGQRSFPVERMGLWVEKGEGSAVRGQRGQGAGKLATGRRNGSALAWSVHTHPLKGPLTSCECVLRIPISTLRFTRKANKTLEKGFIKKKKITAI